MFICIVSVRLGSPKHVIIIFNLILLIDRNNILFLCVTATATAKSLQSRPTLCDPIDGSPPGFPIPGILQARTLEWFAISFSNAWKWKVKVESLSRVWLLASPWTAAYQAPPSMGFSGQQYWSGVPLPSPKLCILMFIKTFIIHIINNSICSSTDEWISKNGLYW